MIPHANFEREGLGHINETDENGDVIQDLDYYVPGWRKSIRSLGINPGDHRTPTPWYYEVSESTLPSGYLSLKSPNPLSKASRTESGQIQNGVGIAKAGFDAYVADSQWHRDVAYDKCLSNLNELTRGSLDLSVDAFQYRQNVKMFQSVGKFEAFTGLFLKRYKTLEGVLLQSGKTIGSLWLQYAYGWKPLIQDIYSTIEEMTSPDLRSSVKFKSQGVSKVNYTEVLPEPVYGFLTHRKTAGKVGCKMKINLAVTTDPGLERFTSLNPASIGWELLPYSFVIDWFYDVGGYLRNVETALSTGRRFQSGSITEYISLQQHVQCFSAGTGSSYSGFWREWQRYVNVSRNVLAEYPLPRLPRFDAHLGSGRLMNAGALLSQFLGKTR